MSEGEAQMPPEVRVQQVIESINDFFSFTSNLRERPDLQKARLACEKSRDAWLSLFPHRRVFLTKYRDLTGDLVQSLVDVTERVAEYLHRNEASMSAEDAADLRHYLDNMRDRVRLMTSLLVGEHRIKKDLSKSTSCLAEKPSSNA